MIHVSRNRWIELTEKNVFTNCSECGCELPFFLTDEFTTDVLCSRCEMKKEKLRMDVGPTYDAIVWLGDLLARSGFAVEVLGVFGEFGIDDLADLPSCEYAEFGSALVKIFTDA